MKVATITELARHVGVNRGTVREWLSDGLPRNADGSFDVAAVEQWRAERGNLSGKDLAAWRCRRERANALRAERELAVAAGQFVPIAEHHAQRLAIIDSFCSSLEQLPSKLAPLLAGEGTYEGMVAQLHAYARSVRIQLAAKHSPPVMEVEAE